MKTRSLIITNKRVVNKEDTMEAMDFYSKAKELMSELVAEDGEWERIDSSEDYDEINSLFSHGELTVMLIKLMEEKYSKKCRPWDCGEENYHE